MFSLPFVNMLLQTQCKVPLNCESRINNFDRARIFLIDFSIGAGFAYCVADKHCYHGIDII